MRKLDFHLPPATSAASQVMSKQDKQQLASDRQRRERLKRQLRLLYDDVAREDVPDALMALVDQIGKAAPAGADKDATAPTQAQPADEASTTAPHESDPHESDGAKKDPAPL